MRVVNRHTSPIDHVAPGAEGDLPDSPAVRALVAAGLLEVCESDHALASPVEVEGTLPPPPPVPSLPSPPPPPPARAKARKR